MRFSITNAPITTIKLIKTVPKNYFIGYIIRCLCYGTNKKITKSKNYKVIDEPLILEFDYQVTQAEVWEALTDSEKMKIWYFPQLEKFEPKVGFEFVFEDRNDFYRKKWIVTKIDKPKIFAHNWAYIGFSGVSEVMFELLPTDNGTKVRVTHIGIESFPDDPHFNRDRFEWGWNNLLGKNLKLLLESE